jgi:hypothetical protein
LVQAVIELQLPIALQVWRDVSLEHWVAPGVHDPVHLPFEHAWLLQAAGIPQVPVESHVCTPLPEHWVAPGVHDPEHAPATHAAPEQATVAPQWPVPSQVCTPPPEHCVEPGLHTP